MYNLKNRLKKSWDNIPWSESTKRLVLILLIVFVAGACFLIYDLFNPSSGNTQSIEKAKAHYPIYSYQQNGKDHVVMYNPDTKKHSEFLTIDQSETVSGFFADYSPDRNQILYSDDTGISLYDIDSAKTTKILTNKPSDAKTAEVSKYSESYLKPQWSYKSTKIYYQISSYESIKYGVMDYDGQNSQNIESEGFGEFAPNMTKSGYAIAAAGGMSALGLFVNIVDPETKTTQILPKDKLDYIYSVSWDKAGTGLIYSSNKDGGTSKSPASEIASIDTNGENYTSLYKENGIILRNLFTDTDDTIYFSKSDLLTSKGAGLFSLSGEKKEVSEVFKDGEKNVMAVGARDDYLVMQTATDLYSKTGLQGLFLMNKSDKKLISLGEAGNISFSGWIREDQVPASLKEVKAPVYTEAEKKAYADSQKTHGYLYKTFYNYCWDYDCQSETYPYAKLTKSIKPEIIEQNEKPVLLTGKVTVPVVVVYRGTQLTDKYYNILSTDTHSFFSYLNTAKWLNSQAMSAGQSLDFSFSWLGQAKFDESCAEYSGTTQSVSMKCMLENLSSEFVQIKNADVAMVVFAQNSATGFVSLGNDYDSTKLVTQSYTIPSFTTEPTEAEMNDENNYIHKQLYHYNSSSWNYTVKSLLKKFGAQVKTATYKKPASGNDIGCFVAPLEDAMCAVKMTSSNMNNAVEFENLIIGEITQKELGWYDSDGNGVREVDEK